VSGQPDRAATHSYLEQRFARSGDDYQPHQPIFGIESGEPGQLLRLARTWRLLTWLEALKPQSVLDLGAAEGYVANLVRLHIGCPVLCSDLSVEACRRAAELYGLPGVAGDLTRLPLRTSCADVVLLSEVFEHLPDPQAGLSAALTYARRYVVFSTQELCANRTEQRLRLALAEVDSPHAELNFITRADLEELFGPAIAMEPEFRRTRRRLLNDVQREQWRSHVEWLAQAADWRTSEGVIAVISVDGTPPPALPAARDPNLLNLLLVGPPRAVAQKPPWDWLAGVSPPQDLVLEVAPTQSSPLHPLLQGKTHVFERLHVPATAAPPAERQRAARLIPWLERIGFLTSADPIAVKLRWLLGRPLA
jgi:SAM-dependent methyltransferase